MIQVMKTSKGIAGRGCAKACATILGAAEGCTWIGRPFGASGTGEAIAQETRPFSFRHMGEDPLTKRMRKQENQEVKQKEKKEQETKEKKKEEKESEEKEKENH